MKMQNALESFVQFMNRKGLNITNQRKAIAEAFFNYPGHHSLENFYRHIADVDDSIGQSTVYRTLKLLCEAGLATETQFSDNITRFEVAVPNRHHDHIVCLKCGDIIEISDPKIEALQNDIARKYDFELTGHSHTLYGYCQKCRTKES